MPLRMSQISRPSLVGRKPVRKQKKKDRIGVLFFFVVGVWISNLTYIMHCHYQLS